MREQYKPMYGQRREPEEEPEMKRRERLHRSDSRQTQKIAMRRSVLMAAICTLCAVCGVLLAGGH